MKKYFYVLILVPLCVFGMEQDELMCAVNKRNAQLCTTLWQKGAPIKPEHLISAADKGYGDVVAFFVSADDSLVEKTNASLKDENYYSEADNYYYSCLMDMALQQRNRTMVQLFAPSADGRHLVRVAKEGWGENLAVLLNHNEYYSEKYLQEAFIAALYAEHTRCCKQLIAKGVLKNTYRGVQTFFENSSIVPQACALLLDHGASRLPEWGGISLLHTVINSIGTAYTDSDDCFGRVAWLEKWIQRHVKGEDVTIELPKTKKGRVHPYDQCLRRYMKTFFVLMTHPTHDTVKEHKTEIQKLLKYSFCPAFERSLVNTGYQLAKWRCRSSVFEELFNPDKVAQWYPAIERAYAKQKLIEIKK